VCVDEKSQIQALDRIQTILLMQPGEPEQGRARQAGVDSLCNGDRLGRDRRVELSDLA